MFKFHYLILSGHGEQALVKSIQKALIPIENLLALPAMMAKSTNSSVAEKLRQLEDLKESNRAATESGLIVQAIDLFNPFVSKLKSDELNDTCYAERKALGLLVIGQSTRDFWKEIDQNASFSQDRTKVKEIKEKFLRQGNFIYLSNSILITLANKYLPRFNKLQKILFDQLEKIDQLFWSDKLSKTHYDEIARYLNELHENLNNFKRSLLYTIYYRLLAASTHGIDLSNVDSLKDDVRVLNALLESRSSADRLELPRDTLRLADPSDLFKMQAILESQKGDVFSRFVSGLKWCNPSSNLFVEFNRTGFPTIVVPRKLVCLIPKNMGWLQWLFGIKSYAYNFLERFAFLFASLNALEGFKYEQVASSNDLLDDIKLQELRHLESSLDKARISVRNERSRWWLVRVLFSRKHNLINEFENFAIDFKKNITIKKHAILRRYVDVIRSLSGHSEQDDIREDGKPTVREIFKSDPFKQQIVDLYCEIEHCFAEDESEDGKALYRNLSPEIAVLREFYPEVFDVDEAKSEPEPDIPFSDPGLISSPVIVVPAVMALTLESVGSEGTGSSIESVEGLATFKIEQLLLLSIDVLEEKIEQFASSCGQFIAKGTAKQQEAARRVIDLLALNYMEHLHEKLAKADSISLEESDKLAVIEKLAYSSDMFISSRLESVKKIAVKRMQSWTPDLIAELEIDIEIAKAGIEEVLKHPSFIVPARTRTASHSCPSIFAEASGAIDTDVNETMNNQSISYATR